MRRQLSQIDEEALKEEFLLVGKIIGHLTRVAGVLVVVDTPERRPTEGDHAYAKRAQRDCLLAINPNYVVE